MIKSKYHRLFINLHSSKRSSRIHTWLAHPSICLCQSAWPRSSKDQPHLHRRFHQVAYQDRTGQSILVFPTFLYFRSHSISPISHKAYHAHRVSSLRLQFVGRISLFFHPCLAIYWETFCNKSVERQLIYYFENKKWNE